MLDDMTTLASSHSPSSAGEAPTPDMPVKSASPRSVFETPHYREIYGAKRVFELDVGKGAPLAFDDRGSHAICLARTASLDSGIVARACEALFAQRRFRFAIFEDVYLPSPPAAPPASLRLHYQNDWVLTLDDSEKGLRQSFQRKMDKKLRRMTREYSDVRLELVRQPAREIVDTAIDLNRRRIEAGGAAYRIDRAKHEKLVCVFTRVGVASVLRHGDRLVSADLFVECGDEAYAILGGYDETYHRDSPGMQTLRHAVDHFAERGFRAVHFMWGDGGYKAWLGAQRVPLSTLIVPSSPGAWLEPGMLLAASRYGFMDTKRRIKERGWNGEAARRVMGWPQLLQFAVVSVA